MASTPTTGDQVSSKRRPGAPDKRARVTDAAVQVFLANGFDRTSMDMVAAQAGVSKTTIYAHYPDKVALFRAVVERSTRMLAVQLDKTRLHPDQDPPTRLTELILAALEATVAPEFLAFLRVMITEGARRPDLAYQADPADLVDLIGLIASALSDEAKLRDYQLSDPRAFATLLLRMSASSPQLDSLLFAKFRPDRALLRAHARWITTVFLRGIEPRAGEAREVVPPTEDYSYPWLPDGRDEDRTRSA